jgi:hypothetical protein
MDLRAASLRQMRTVHAIFIAVVFMYGYVSEVVVSAGTEITQPFIYAFAVLACGELMLARYFHAKKAIPAMEKIRRAPNDAEALKQWRAGILVTLVLVLSVALYGFVLRILGAGRRVAWPFFAVALIFLLVWRPNLCPEGEFPSTGNAQ